MGPVVILVVYFVGVVVGFIARKIWKGDRDMTEEAKHNVTKAKVEKIDNGYILTYRDFEDWTNHRLVFQNAADMLDHLALIFGMRVTVVDLTINENDFDYLGNYNGNKNGRKNKKGMLII